MRGLVEHCGGTLRAFFFAPAYIGASLAATLPGRKETARASANTAAIVRMTVSRDVR
jgi:hypothetical protein